jgi:hypothetical protein
MVMMMWIEDWEAIDSFYWATVTVMTVGYGDFEPASDDGKLFTIFYALFGCTIMAMAFTDFGNFFQFIILLIYCLYLSH